MKTYVFSDEHNCDHAYVRLADHDAALRRAKAEGLLVWTTEKPTKPGQYWYRDKGLPPDIIVVEGDGSDKEPLIVRWECASDELVENIIGEWAGPIPAPLDARAAQIEEGE